uniref:Uncharacterized protein n=1 Tax=Arundo donax TaxID=35708 RepID=A0A0A9A682_ARUDO
MNTRRRKPNHGSMVKN